jgi:hypothetical protein
VVLEAIASLRSRWAAEDAFGHPVLSVPSLLPTMIAGGEWPVTYPSSCELTLAVMYLPVQADPGGWGSAVREEVQAWILRECARDDWLAEHPPEFRWWANGVMPMEIAPSEPVVETMLGASGDLGLRRDLGGLDSWYDGRGRCPQRGRTSTTAEEEWVGGAATGVMRVGAAQQPPGDTRPPGAPIQPLPSMPLTCVRVVPARRYPSTRCVSSTPFLPMSTR